MSEVVEGVPIGYTVAGFDPQSRLPQELSGKDLFGDVEEAAVEAGLCAAWAEKHNRPEVFMVCAVVPLADWGGGEAAGTATGEAQEGRGASGTVPRE
jgi:hypothetical protein